MRTYAERGAARREKAQRDSPEKLRGANDALRLHHPNARNTGAPRGPRLRGLCVPAKPHPVGRVSPEGSRAARLPRKGSVDASLRMTTYVRRAAGAERVPTNGEAHVLHRREWLCHLFHADARGWGIRQRGRSLRSRLQSRRPRPKLQWLSRDDSVAESVGREGWARSVSPLRGLNLFLMHPGASVMG